MLSPIGAGPRSPSDPYSESHFRTLKYRPGFPDRFGSLQDAKSKQAGGVSPITSLIVTREASDGGSKITTKGERADGSKIDTVTTVKFDGKPVSVAGTGLTWDTTSIKKQSGMFWTVRGANAIIALRCCHLNNRMENYWEIRRAA